MLGGSVVVKHFSDAALLGIHRLKESIDVSARPVTKSLVQRML